MNIGQAIRELRQERGLKQETVALDAGTDSGYLSRIETGERLPSIEMLERVALALNTSVAELFARAEGLTPAAIAHNADDAMQAESSRLCLHYFRSLNPGNQRLAVELLKTLCRMQD